MKITWHGHGTWQIDVDDNVFLLDPFFDDNPSAVIKAEEANADFILVSHGHFDHVADVASIANRCKAKVIAIYEIANWFAEKHSVADTLGMNIGGKIDLGVATIKMTRAIHSSQLPDGSYGGVPAGYLFSAEGKDIYFACDTALFSDMDVISTTGLDLAVLPIGDLYTMGIDDSIEAIKLTNPKKVAPAHYNTWPPIEQNADAWAALVSEKTRSEPVVVNPGESFEI